jgi:hypothetical protein
MEPGRRSQMFWRNVPLPSLGSKSKLSRVLLAPYLGHPLVLKMEA